MKLMASKRLMDPAPARVDALEHRIIDAIKRSKLTSARRLLIRRLALCGPADAARAALEKLAATVDSGIAHGLDGVPQDTPE